MTEHDAVGSYVLDALDDAERAEFEAHLATCMSCQAEVAELRETVAQMSVLAAAPAPPAALRRDVLAALGRVEQLPPLERVTAVAGREPARTGEVDELAQRRQQRRIRLLNALLAAVLAVAVALGGTVVGLVRNRHLQAENATAEAQLYTAPDVRIVRVPMANGGEASFVVSKADNRALFVGTNLPAAGLRKKYQLWTLQGQAVTPDNLLDGGVSTRRWFRGDIAASTNLAVTIEPERGSPTPTLPILAVAEI